MRKQTTDMRRDTGRNAPVSLRMFHSYEKQCHMEIFLWFYICK